MWNGLVLVCKSYIIFINLNVFQSAVSAENIFVNPGSRQRKPWHPSTDVDKILFTEEAPGIFFIFRLYIHNFTWSHPWWQTPWHVCRQIIVVDAKIASFQIWKIQDWMIISVFPLGHVWPPGIAIDCVCLYVSVCVCVCPSISSLSS